MQINNFWRVTSMKELYRQLKVVFVRSVFFVLAMSTLSWAEGGLPSKPSPHAPAASSYAPPVPAKPGFLPVVIYSMPTCSWCTRAKELFEAKNIPIKVIDVTQDPRAYGEMQKKTSKTTVPQIFVGGRHVGSYWDVYKLSDEDFDKMVRGE